MHTTSSDAPAPGRHPPPGRALLRSLGRTAPGLLGACVLVACTLFFSLKPLSPSSVVPTSGPAEVFSAQRAWPHVEALAAEPRPVGSAGHQRAQRYLQERLRASGAEVHLLTGSSVNVRYGIPFEAGRVTNILARLRGMAPEEASAVLLVAHYDSMPGSPGAGDDAVGIAVLLETLRALKAGPALKGDVLFLFTDAEEGGLLGIQSFIQQHVGRERVGFVLNLDARGVRGPALLVSAAGPVGELVSGATRAAAPLTASSAFLWMARPWTRGTDFSPLAEAGLAGLNFVIVDGAARYHTGGDTPEALDAGSLQHAGDMVTALSRWFATHPVGVRDPPGGPDTFFTVGPWLVRYPASLSLALSLLAAALAIAAYRMGARRGRWSSSQWLRALPWALVLPAACAALGVAAWWLLSRVHPSLQPSPRADPYAPASFRAGLLLFCVALAAGLARRLSPEGRRWAGPPAAAVLALLLSVRAAEASYLLALPLLAQAGVALWRARAEGTEPAPALLDAAVLAVTVCLWAPFLFMGWTALPLAQAALSCAITGLGLLPLLPFLGRLRGAWGLFLGAALLCLLAGAFSARVGTVAQPTFSDVAYGWDAAAGRGTWLSMGQHLDRYAHTLLGNEALRGPNDFVNATDERVWQAPAPAEPLPAPRVQPELDEVRSDGTRQVRLRLTSSREAPWLWVFLSPAVQVLEASVDGLPVADAASAPFPGERWGFRFVGLPPDGIVLGLRVRVSGEGGDLTVVDQTFGLPASAPPRPGDVVTGRSWLSGSSLARTVWRLPGAVP